MTIRSMLRSLCTRGTRAARPARAAVAAATAAATLIFGVASVVPSTARAEHRVASPADSSEYTYTFRLTARSTDAKGRTRDEPPLVARVRTLGDRARIDILEGSKDFSRGDYVLTDAAGTMMRKVSPTKREYSEATLAELQHVFAAVVKASVERPRVALSTPQPGDMVVDLPTQRVRLERSYDAQMRIVLRSLRASVRETTDVWATTALSGFENPAERLFTGMRRAVADGAASGGGELASRTREVESRIPGVPLKTVTTVVTETKDGRSTDVVTTEITDIRRESTLAPSDVEVPAGYRRRQS